MASYQAIAATSKGVLGLLEDAYRQLRDTSPGVFGPAQFEPYQTSDFQNPMTEGFSLYLYRVAVNRTRRTLPTRPNPNGGLPVSPLAVDLSYMLSAHAAQAEKQQLLLGWAMRVLEDNSILPATLLNHYAPQANTFRPTETVELIAETLSVQDLSAIWDVMKPKVPVATTYVARLVELESLRMVSEGPLVQTRNFDIRKQEEAAS